jgi:hypothetical protein
MEIFWALLFLLDVIYIFLSEDITYWGAWTYNKKYE